MACNCVLWCLLFTSWSNGHIYVYRIVQNIFNRQVNGDQERIKYNADIGTNQIWKKKPQKTDVFVTVNSIHVN